MLTILVSRYKVEVLEEPQFAGETFEERKARVLATKFGLTLRCVYVLLDTSKLFFQTDILILARSVCPWSLRREGSYRISQKY